MARLGGRAHGGRRSRGSGAGRTGGGSGCVDAGDESGGDGVARAAILAEAGASARRAPGKTAAPERAAVSGGVMGVPRGTARRRARYSAMSADAFAGRAGAAPVACDGAPRSIFGGGDSCSTSLV